MELDSIGVGSIGNDLGARIGTFDEDSGALITTKTPSTPHDPAVGFLTGLAKVLDLIARSGDSVSAVSHGTTVVRNWWRGRSVSSDSVISATMRRVPSHTFSPPSQSVPI